jgi:hypothetical protein
MSRVREELRVYRDNLVDKNCVDKIYKQSKLYYNSDKMTKPTGYKPFSEKAYWKFSIFEQILKDNVEISNHEIVRNPDRYGIDLLVLNEDGMVVGGLEAESHGKYWGDKGFPFKTCHFLYRKKKYIEPHHFYVMINRSGKEALMMPFWELENHNTKIINNAACRGEKFYDVPIRSCIMGWDDINDYLEKYFNGDLPEYEYPEGE